MTRPQARIFFICIGLAVLSFSWVASAMDWKAYQQAFVSGDGRVVDFFQNSISHSEGQGYGLLLALMNGDRPAFERMVKWTTDNLQVRRDALFAWSWGQRPNGEWNVIDYNNASDGDILIAFALLKAADRWGHPPFGEAARRILRDVRAHLTVSPQDYQLIAPAYFGFNGQSSNIFNTGYLVLPAFAEFARVDDEAYWKRILRDSQRLLEKAAFSSFKLPADWVALENGQVIIAASRSAFFGFEAIRVPLYLVWQGAGDRLRSFSAYLDFIERAGYLPSRVNLIDGSMSGHEAPAGFHAVMGLCAERLGRAALAQKLFQEAGSRLSREPKDYYSNSLFLLATGKLD
ncbi:MAG: glycosyl hydrolase family 8 [Hyphomicrobiales bacterium]